MEVDKTKPNNSTSIFSHGDYRGVFFHKYSWAQKTVLWNVSFKFRQLWGLREFTKMLKALEPIKSQFSYLQNGDKMPI